MSTYRTIGPSEYHVNLTYDWPQLISCQPIVRLAPVNIMSTYRTIGPIQVIKEVPMLTARVSFWT